MAPLILQKVIVGQTPHHIGIFGFTRSAPMKPKDLIGITQQVTAKQDLTLLVVDADFVAGSDHLFFATIHAYTAFSQKSNVASTRHMEILRYAAAQRQISQALNLLGVSESTRRFAGVLVNSTAGVLEPAYLTLLSFTEATDNATVLELNTSEKAQAIQEVFEIPDKELVAICPSQKFDARKQALQKLVYDRCALVAITR